MILRHFLCGVFRSVVYMMLSVPLAWLVVFTNVGRLASEEEEVTLRELPMFR